MTAELIWWFRILVAPFLNVSLFQGDVPLSLALSFPAGLSHVNRSRAIQSVVTNPAC